MTLSTAKRSLATLAVGSAMLVAAAAPAAAQVEQDGLVNVNIGDVTILENVDIDLAALVAAQICGVDLDVNVLSADLADDGQSTVCTLRPGNVTITE